MTDTPSRGLGISWKQAVGIPLNVIFFLLLMVMAWGSIPGFFAHPTRVGVVVLHILMIPIMTLRTAGRSRGTSHVADWKPFFPLLMMHSLFTAWVMPYMDARNIWVLPGGDLLRWIGFVILAIGVVFRLASMLTLGRRFASVVAFQEGHSLHTSGLYTAVRHPSYVGILLMDIGFAGVFRSAVALALLPIVWWMFKRRMDVEEGFMLDAFPTEYRDYMQRTRRLIPGVY